MSLKAKLEAVIYAAEEPVTLAQLAGLFTDDALEWKTERDAVAAAAAAASMAPTGADATATPLLSEAFTYLELDAEAEADANGAIAGENARITARREPGATSEPGATEQATAPTAETTAPAEERGAGADGETAAETAAEPSAADEAATAKQLAKQREREARSVIKQMLSELIAEYAADGRGIEIREIAGGYRMATKPEFHDAVRSFVKSLKPPLKLSLPALETLAVIAYKQPVTAPEVNEIRGVDSSAVFGSLLARKLIVTAGRKPVVGRPILYKTTREFLLRFGLKDVSELPSMEEFEKMAASELDADAMPQEAAASGEAEEFNPDPSVEQDEAEAVAPEGAQDAEPEAGPHAQAENETSAANGAA